MRSGLVRWFSVALQLLQCSAIEVAIRPVAAQFGDGRDTHETHASRASVSPAPLAARNLEASIAKLALSRLWPRHRRLPLRPSLDQVLSPEHSTEEARDVPLDLSASSLVGVDSTSAFPHSPEEEDVVARRALAPKLAVSATRSKNVQQIHHPEEVKRTQLDLAAASLAGARTSPDSRFSEEVLVQRSTRRSAQQHSFVEPSRIEELDMILGVPKFVWVCTADIVAMAGFLAACWMAPKLAEAPGQMPSGLPPGSLPQRPLQHGWSPSPSPRTYGA
mmetsp:Transcript_62574/g.179495  ORF Transcript_62574/g.179495 Transcript_62574/m.179495 type:complete len:276 (+) Transcript_62574:30-857(+)